MTTSTQSFSIIPSDLLVDAVGVNVGEGISREVPLLGTRRTWFSTRL